MSAQSTYKGLLRAWRRRNGGFRGVVSIGFHRRGAHFSKLYMPRRLKGSSNGGFMRAPRESDS